MRLYEYGRIFVKTVSIVLLVVLTVLMTGFSKQEAKVQNQKLTLEVALFPYVPDRVRFQEAVSDAWKREHPDVSLHFADWDCYASDPDPSIDVFVFDGIYLSSFVEEGYLLPIPKEKIRNKEDIIPFALKGCISGGKFYALPQLLCADFLYTRKDDAGLSDVSDIDTLYKRMGDRQTKSIIPEGMEGLLIDLSDGFFAKTVIYLDALMDETQTYTEYGKLPETAHLSDTVLKRMRNIGKMGGEEQVTYSPEDNDSFIRARWFKDGKGRAYIGYSESLAAMGDYVDKVNLRLFSYGPGKNVPLFYTDMVGIHSKISEDKKALAYDLANVLISEEVLSKMSRPSGGGDTPQYLLTARKSVYDSLGKDYPVYYRLKEIMMSRDNHVFRMGTGARRFIKEMEKVLYEKLIRKSGSQTSDHVPNPV